LKSKKVLGVSPSISEGRDEARTSGGKDVLSVGLVRFPDKKHLLDRKKKSSSLEIKEGRSISISDNVRKT
jgi:hypothetical protein